MMNEKIHEQSMKHKFIYSMTGLFLGLVCVVGGILLFLNSVVGSTNWTANFFGNESAITDAGPGSILFIVGLFVIIITRYKVKVNITQDNNGHQKTDILYSKKID